VVVIIEPNAGAADVSVPVTVTDEPVCRNVVPPSVL